MSRKLLATIGAVLLFASTAEAAPYRLDFEVSRFHTTKPPAPGEWTFDGQPGSTAVGDDIEVDTFSSIGTPLNDGAALTIDGGRFNFTSGAYQGSVSMFGMAFLSFGAGGSLTITGSVDLGGGNIVSGTLVEAQFNSLTIQAGFHGTLLAIGSYYGTTHSGLEDYFGIRQGEEWEGNFNLSFGISGTLDPSDPSFVSTETFSGDIVNSVPEPMTALLLGAGSLGAGVVSRRRRRAAEKA